MSSNWFSSDDYAVIAQGGCPQCQRKTVISQKLRQGQRTQILCRVCGWSLAADNAGGLAAAGTSLILQHWLVKLLHLRDLKRDYDALRKEVLTMLNAGAAIEPGILTADIDNSPRRQISWPALQRLLGEDQTEALKNRIEPAPSSELLILPSSWQTQSISHLSSVADL